jgi:hypothetical protein
VSARLLSAGLLAAMVASTCEAAAECKPSPDAVVGDGCTQYARDWSSEFWPVSASLSARTLSYVPGRGASFDGNVESSPLAYHFAGSALGVAAMRAYGGETTLLWLPSRFLYLGAAGGYAAGNYSGAPIKVAGLTITPGTPLNMSQSELGVLAGVRIPLGWVAVRAGAMIGANWISLDQYAAPSTTGSSLTSTASAVELLVEPRLDVDVFLTPVFSIGAFATMPFLVPQATNVGLTFTAHLRAFDGGAWPRTVIRD